MEECSWIGKDHNFQFSLYRATQIILSMLLNFFMYQFVIYKIVFKIIVSNPLNTCTDVYSGTVNDTFIPFFKESIAFNHISSETYWLV